MLLFHISSITISFFFWKCFLYAAIELEILLSLFAIPGVFVLLVILGPFTQSFTSDPSSNSDTSTQHYCLN